LGFSFALQRPVRLVRSLFVNRDRPDLHKLSAIRDPQTFVWAILPHAARTFSASIVLLPRPLADASAVAYLYCRMLDTYEDLVACPSERDRALALFAERLGTGTPAPPIETELARDQRDEAHLLLVQRCDLVDRAYAQLDPEVQALICTLVRNMAEGMRWSSAMFERQRGVLESEDQLTRYCRNVLGEPVLFSARLLCWHQHREPVLPESVETDAMAVGEMIQLANVTRDIEKDLARGIGYHPDLRDDLGAGTAGNLAQAERVRRVRAELMNAALQRAPAYRRLVEHLSPRRFSMARASAVLMLLFTDRYFRACAIRADLPSWGKRRSGARLLLTALPAALSPRWARTVLAWIETNFLAAAATPAG